MAHIGQLLAGGGPERVARGQQHLGARTPDSRLATLPTVVVLPTPLTPTNSQTSTRSSPSAVVAVGAVALGPGAGQGQRGVGGREHRHQVGLERVDQRVGAGDLARS